MFKHKKIIVALLAASVLSGCGITRLSGVAEESLKKTVSTVDESLKKTAPEEMKMPLVEKSSGVWLGKKTKSIEKVEYLPPVFNSIVTFDDTLTLQDAANRITVRYGVPIKIAREVTLSMTGAGMSQPMAAAAGNGTVIQPPMLSPNFAKIAYTGSLSGLLDIVSSRFGAHWKYQNGAVQFFILDTKTFAIRAIPGDSALTSQVSNSTAAGSGGAGGSGGGSTNNGGSTSSTSVNSTLSVWTGMKDSIQSMLSAAGKVIVSPATGSVTVTDTPEILDRVESFINAQNESLSRQVMFNVKIYSVSLSDDDDYQINWNFVYNSLSQNYGVNLKNSFGSSASSSSFGLSVLDTATGGAAKYAGTDVLFNALSTQGKTSLVTSASVSTLNTQPVPVQVARQTSYLQSVATTVTANVGSTATLTPGTFTTGFSMNLLPNILDKGQLLLQYSIDLSVLNNLSTVTSGDNTIQIPEIDTRNFLQRVAMNTGETLVLTGFEQNTDSLQKQGVGSPNVVAAGGGVKATKNRDIVVVAITPIITTAR